MRDTSFLRILHISDLHFTGKPFEPHIAARRAGSAMQDFAAEPPDALFRVMLVDYLKKNHAEDEWPSVIVVSGDLVDKGGTDGDEFGRVRVFLADLAADLGIRDKKRVFVVPGNHDVTWKRELNRHDKFAAFSAAMKEFTRPIMDGDDPEAVIVSLDGIRRGVHAQLALLISPTFSGIEAPLEELERKVREMLKKETQPANGGSGAMSESQIDEILAAVREAQSLLDIALVGSRQLTKLREISGEGMVRLAVMHHHLLPDPQIDLAQFESVLDAGRTLDTLLQQKFDLVLHGHKHNAHLVTYRHANRSINVYAAPSLFMQPATGFALIDIHPTESSKPIRLTQFEIDYRSRQLRPKTPELLEREGRIVPAVLERLAEVSPDHQLKIVEPVVAMVGELSKWSREYKNDQLFESIWSDFLAEVEGLHRRRIVLRRNLAEQWKALLDHADAGSRPEVLLVSNDDLDYWIRSAEEGTPAHEYRQPLAQFRGKKSRILIVRGKTLKSKETAAKLEHVIADMLNDNFTVILTRRKKLPRSMQEADFGIIGRFAVSRFDDREGVIRRLNVSFDEKDVKETYDTWQTIRERYEWKGSPGISSDAFRKWLKREYKTEL